MKSLTTTLPNALIRKNSEFLVKDQIIFQYSEAITAKQVKAQVNYLLGKRALNATVEVKELNKNKHIFLIAAPGAHLLEDEVANKPMGSRPIPPPPPPIYPVFISKNTITIEQIGLKNLVLFKADTIRNR
ncbi:hypothetical protein [Olivibacter domesticus]|uniref:Uncharacterized protein n=1 Tax=Olivibacter domesticus TaxID=407022 RepID=A0A1H7HFW0_OLID1|nr:hypothetical protein [Olivibacter domesticus]SEK48322.1 hypothetical protein SAMN05661044_00350 [Olivibacter domesticus]